MHTSRLQQLILNRVIDALGEDAHERRTIAEFEPIFFEAEDHVVKNIHLLDAETERSARWSLKYGRKRRARSAAHNERAILKKLGCGFRHFADAVTLAEDANRDLFVDSAQWLRDSSPSSASLIAQNGVGGAPLHVLIMLGMHARGCVIASEIDMLARKGYTEGAHARARSLYELMILAAFISEKETADFELTERYHLSALVERRKDARHMGEEDPFDSEDGLEQALRNRWGSGFFQSYGWASLGMQGRPSSSRVTFRDIEESTGLDGMRHCYLTMNHAIHGGAMAITTRFDRRNPFRNVTGSEVNHYSIAWVMGAAAKFFHCLNRITLQAVSDLVDPEQVFYLTPLAHCDSAEDFFWEYAISHEPDQEN